MYFHLCCIVIGLSQFFTLTVTVSIGHRTDFATQFKEAMNEVMKKYNDLSITCPPNSFFYNGSCFFYLPPKRLEFTDLSIDEASDRCRMIRADLWDIESVAEFDHIIGYVYQQIQSYDSPRIAVNFTRGKRLLNLKKRLAEQQFLTIGNTNEYSLIYKPLSDLSNANTSLIIDISRATHRVSLEEKFRLERRSNRYICKMKINSCYNNSRCGRHGQCQNLIVKYRCICNFMYTGEYCHQFSSRGIQTILGLLLIIVILIILFLHTTRSISMKTIDKYSTMSKSSGENFYSIPNLSSDQLLKSTTIQIDSKIFNEKKKISTNYSKYLQRFSIGFFTLIFATICCQTIYHLKTIRNSTEKSKLCSLFETKLNFYFKIPPNFISLVLLVVLFVLLILFENRSFRFRSFSFPILFNSHSHLYRFQSAAVFGLIALEILHIFDEYIMHSERHFRHGPLLDLIVQIGLGLMLGFRYFPLLSIFERENFRENRLENSFLYGFASIYLYTELIFKLQSDVQCSVEFDREKIFYEILRQAPFYYFIVYLSICLTLEFFRTIFGRTNRSSNYQNYARWKYVKENLCQRSHRSNSSIHSSRIFRFLNSFVEFFKRNFYQIRPFFRYSKLIICIYTSGLTLIYYFTFWIQDHTYILTKKFLLFFNLILCTLADLSADLCYNLNFDHINRDIRYICYLTALITSIQLFCGLRHYQIQMCRAYRGVFEDIPSIKHLSSVSVISKSIHYPGRFMGSLVYSYAFLFIVISMFYILARYIFYSLIILEFISKLLLPMFIFFLFQLLSVRLLCKILFVENSHFFALKNLRLYYTFSYFSFFFDCFLGFLTCLTRMSKAFLCALIFFARLDYSPYGRGLELFDSSYASYVSFFHLERHQRHPVLNVFIDLIRQRCIDRRKSKRNSSFNDEKERLSQLYRFRWALAYTLIHNEQLKRFRKHRLTSPTTNQSKTLERLFDRFRLTMRY